MTLPARSAELKADRQPVRYGIRFLLAVSAALLAAVTAALTAYAYLSLDRLQERMEALAEGNLAEITLARRLHEGAEALLRPLNLMAELPAEAPTTATLSAVELQIKELRASADTLATQLGELGAEADQARMASARKVLDETERAIREFSAAAGRRAVAESRLGERAVRLDSLFDQHFQFATRVENQMRSLVSTSLASEIPEAAEPGQLKARLDNFLQKEMVWLAVAQDLRTDARELFSQVRSLERETQAGRLPATQKNVEAYAARLQAWRRLPAGDSVGLLGKATDAIVGSLAAPPTLAQLRAEELAAESAVAAAARNAASIAGRFSGEIQNVSHELGHDVRDRLRQTRKEVQLAQRTLTLAAILAAIVGILLVYVVVTRRIIHPLEGITEAMRRAAWDLSDGKPDWQRALGTQTVAGNDEVAAMHRALQVFRDMLMKREEELVRSEARLHTILVTINEAIQLWDNDGLLVYSNNAADHLFGVSVGQRHTQASTNWQFLHEDETPFASDEFPHIMTLRTGSGQTGVIMKVVNPIGYSHWLLINAQPVLGGTPDELLGVVTSCSDISEFKLHQSELEYLAHHDPLTNLPNRTLLEDRLEHAIVNADRHGTMLAVCYLDLDGFKPVNDRYGHAAGDALLREIALRLKANLRGGDTVARLGGDEFVLLLCELDDIQECRHTLERVLQSVGSPCNLGSEPAIRAFVTASIGVTIYPMDKADSNALLRHADYAMYMAKQSGKNAFQVFQPNPAVPPQSDRLH